MLQWRVIRDKTHNNITHPTSSLLRSTQPITIKLSSNTNWQIQIGCPCTGLHSWADAYKSTNFIRVLLLVYSGNINWVNRSQVNAQWPEQLNKCIVTANTNVFNFNSHLINPFNKTYADLQCKKIINHGKSVIVLNDVYDTILYSTMWHLWH